MALDPSRRVQALVDLGVARDGLGGEASQDGPLLGQGPLQIAVAQGDGRLQLGAQVRRQGLGTLGPAGRVARRTTDGLDLRR